ncbi:MAG TPA: hypothetical protein VJ852_12100 [Gemmatimonadaceae bacterium]|nr:hypothetical protein [Gemmatimonadaceae bacterium]
MRSMAVLLAIGVVRIAGAQTGDATARLLSAAREGTARYRSIDSAIADGFKRVGVEFPAMGEHWVNVARVLENRFNPARPSVLTYISVGGERQLAGVAYTALLADGEQPPNSAAPQAYWHEHNGTVAEESLPMHHTTGMTAIDGSGSPRLSILHAWVWLPNPAGPFVTDNWTLPLARLGINASHRALSPDAIRGVSLANDNASYYEQTIETSLAPTDPEWRLIQSIVARHRAEARAEARKDPTLRDGSRIAAAWTSMWNDLEKSLPRDRAGLRSLRGRL